MVTTARGYPRFLPTLTEIVRAPARVVVPAEPVQPVPDPTVLEAERRQALVEHLRAHLLTAIDDKVQDVVASAMLEQVDLIGERLRRQMDDMVRESLEAVAARLRAELEVLVDEAVDAVLATPAPTTQDQPLVESAS